MATLARLKDAEIEGGNLALAADIDAELDQLVNGHNDHDTRLIDIEDNAYTFDGQKTFSSGIKTNTIDERSAASGVTIDGVVLKDTKLKASSSSPTLAEGEFGYNTTTNTYQGHDGTSTVTFLTSNAPYPRGHIGFDEAFITYTNASTITIPAGTTARDGTNTYNMDVGSNITVSLAVSGAGGLDNGAEAGDTTYYVYLCGKSTDRTDNTAVFSITNEFDSGNITLPSGYDIKRQLPIAVRNDGSSNIIPFYGYALNGNTTQIMYDVNFDYNTANNETVVLSAGTATTFTSISCASFIPAISTIGIFWAEQASNSYEAYVRPGGSSNTTGQFILNAYINSEEFQSKTSNTQTIEYKATSAVATDVSVMGYIVNWEAT